MPARPDPKEVALHAPAGHAPGCRRPRGGLVSAGVGSMSAAPGAALRVLVLLVAALLCAAPVTADAGPTPEARDLRCSGGADVLAAALRDGRGQVTLSSPVSITVNARPVASLLAPLAGMTLTISVPVALSATVADPDGTIAMVDFFVGPVLAGSAVTANSGAYRGTWTPMAPGTVVLTARATDAQGAVTNSAPVSVTVGAPNLLPTAIVAAPVDGARLPMGVPTTVSATVADGDGRVVAATLLFDGAAVASATPDGDINALTTRRSLGES